MDPETRRRGIAQFIAEHGGADVTLLAERFGVSPMTIRRDRQILVQRQMVAPTHGGAVPVRFVYGEMDYSRKVRTRLNEKTAIAKRALELIEDDTCIFLDSGTTTRALAKQLTHRRLSVITIDLYIAIYLSKSPGVKVYVPGGEVDSQIQGLLDAHALNFLKGVNASLAFIGAAAWDAQKGVTTSSIAKQASKRALLEQADSSVLLCDSSKYGLCNPWEVAPLKGFSYIITDSFLSEDCRGLVERAGTNLLITEPAQAEA